MDEKELLHQLRSAFRSEAGERLASLGTHLLALENEVLSEEERTSAIETVFRELHSLKGAARAVNFSSVETLCQESESILALVKRGKLPLDAPLFDTLHRVIELIEGLIEADLHDRSLPFAKEINAISDKLRKLGERIPSSLSGGEQSAAGAEQGDSGPALFSGAPATVPVLPTQANAPSPEESLFESRPSALAIERATMPTVRVAMEKLDNLLLQAEEMVALKLMGRHQLLLVESITHTIARWHRKTKDLSGEIRLLRHDRRLAQVDASDRSRKATARILDFLDWQQTLQQDLGKEIRAIRRAAKEGQYLLEPSIDTMLDDMKKVIMLPFATVYDPLPMMARSIARQQNKLVHLVLVGGDIEIDRRILDEMKDPLIHLIRNAIDHAVESPAAREAQGKLAEAKIEVAVDGREDGTVHIRVTDNGCGINLQNVRKMIADLDDRPPAEIEAMAEEEVLQHIFRSGVSTSPMVTDISGRGIGLAIVKERVSKLGGTVEVDTIPGKGTSFAMRLPVTLASFRGILVQVGASRFVIPSTQVEGVLRFTPEAVRTVENRATIPYKGEVVSLVVLADLLGVPHRPRLRTEASVHAVVLADQHRRIAFQVQEVQAEQEFLVKGLGPQLSRVRNIAGVTILGSGLMAPVLNVQDLLASAVGIPFKGAVGSGGEGEEAPGKRLVMVVEDSITSRMLIKNILEGAGYAVITAVDGMDAITKLASERVDLVVTDVEMPRLDGFALTAKIRAEPRLADLPVILLTGLETREHRERGIEVGANAYLVKSGFDQSNLLEVVARFLA